MGMTTAAQALISPLMGQTAATGGAGQTGSEAPSPDAFAALLALIPGAQPAAVVLAPAAGAAGTGDAEGAIPSAMGNLLDGGAMPMAGAGFPADGANAAGEAVAAQASRRPAPTPGTFGQLLSPAMRGWAAEPSAAPSTGPGTAATDPSQQGDGVSQEVFLRGLPQADAALPQLVALATPDLPGQTQSQTSGQSVSQTANQSNTQTPNAAEDPQSGQAASQNPAVAAVQRTLFSAAAAGIAVAGRGAARERASTELAAAANGQLKTGTDAGSAPLRPGRHQQTTSTLGAGDVGQGSGAAGQGGQAAIGSVTGQADGQASDGALNQATASNTATAAADTLRPAAPDAPRVTPPASLAGDASHRSAQATGTDPALAGTASDTSSSLDSGVSTGQESAPQQSARPEQMLRMPAHHIPVFAMNLMRRFESGARAFQLRLDPPELGKVEVKLTVGPDRSVEAVVSTDRPEALVELQRAARDLAAALQEAGLDLIDGGLSFQLDQSGQDQTGAQDQASPDQSGQSSGQTGRTTSSANAAEAANQPTAPATDISAPRRGGAAHDIWQRARVAVSA